MWCFINSVSFENLVASAITNFIASKLTSVFASVSISFKGFVLFKCAYLSSNFWNISICLCWISDKLLNYLENKYIYIYIYSFNDNKK